MSTSASKLQVFSKCHIYHIIYVFLSHSTCVRPCYHFYSVPTFSSLLFFFLMLLMEVLSIVPTFSINPVVLCFVLFFLCVLFFSWGSHYVTSAGVELSV
jgi:hypothetical protein